MPYYNGNDFVHIPQVQLVSRNRAGWTQLSDCSSGTHVSAVWAATSDSSQLL